MKVMNAAVVMVLELCCCYARFHQLLALAGKKPLPSLADVSSAQRLI